MACSPGLSREQKGLHQSPPPPGTLREGAEPGDRRRRMRGNLRWASSQKLPCTALSLDPETRRYPTLRSSPAPPKKNTFLQQLKPSTGQPPLYPQMPTSFGLGVVSRWHMLIEGPAQLSPPLQSLLDTLCKMIYSAFHNA